MSKRILVVDDEVPIADLLSQALADEGYETRKVVQSLRVFDAVREYRPDLILLDLMMPYLNGQDELRLISMDQESQRQIPVIVVTGCVDDSLEARALALGARAVLRKPLSIDHLRAIVSSIGKP